MLAERESLKAVHDSDLEEFLEGLGLFSDFINHRLQCSTCRNTLTWDNLYAIYPDSGTVKLSCNRPDCVEQLMVRLNELKSR